MPYQYHTPNANANANELRTTPHRALHSHKHTCVFFPCSPFPWDHGRLSKQHTGTAFTARPLSAVSPADLDACGGHMGVTPDRNEQRTVFVCFVAHVCDVCARGAARCQVRHVYVLPLISHMCMACTGIIMGCKTMCPSLCHVYAWAATGLVGPHTLWADGPLCDDVLALCL